MLIPLSKPLSSLLITKVVKSIVATSGSKEEQKQQR